MLYLSYIKLLEEKNMKKIILLAVLLFVALGFAYAQSNPFNMVDLNTFEGNWVDERADAIWDFGMKSIRILHMDESEAFDFGKVTIKGIWVDPEAKNGLILKYEWLEGGWKYTISKRFSDNHIDLKIVKPSGYIYEVTLRPTQQ